MDELQGWKDKATALLQLLSDTNDKLSSTLVENARLQRMVAELETKVADLTPEAPKANGHDEHASAA